MGLSELIVDENGNSFSLPSETFEIAIKEIVTKKLGDINQFTIECSAGSGKGDNYLGIVCRIQVKNKSDGKIQMSLVLKSAPQNAERREQFYIHEVYEREISFYDEIYPLYEKFQREKGIDEEKEGFHHVAKCYQTLSEEPYEGIIFEDLKFNGFEMFDRHKELTREHVMITMKALAKMHAVGFAIKDQRPELIEKYKSIPDLLVKICADQDSSIRLWFETQKKLAATVIDKCQNEELKKRIKKVLDADFISQFDELVDGRLAEPYANICHGDCWNNNIMYQNDKNGTPQDIKLLDFQIMRYASPICDLSYYLFGCTTKNLRDKHFKECMDVYYDTLSTLITKLGSCPEKFFPRKAFDDHWKRFGKFAILMGIVVVPAFVAEAEDTPDMDEVAIKWKESRDDPTKEFDASILSFTSEKSIEEYERRMVGIYEDAFEMGFI